MDKWLWATRLFKTRSQAAAACRRGQVTLANAEVKPSRTLKVGETLQVRRDDLVRTVSVLAFPLSRVGAKLVQDYLSDETPIEEIERAKEIRAQKAANRVFRMPGEGRPTKKQLREIQKFIDAGGSTDVKRWAAASELTAYRVGLLLSGDLRIAGQMISQEQAPLGVGATMSPRDKIKELVLYSISEDYFTARRAVGLTAII